MEENRNKYERKSKEIFTINQSGLQMTANLARFLSNHCRPRTEIGLTAQVLKGYNRATNYCRRQKRPKMSFR